MSISAPTLGLLLDILKEQKVHSGDVISLGVPELPKPGQFDYAAYNLPEFGQFEFRELFRQLGFGEVMAVDVSDYQGSEVVHDLNEPIDSSLHGRFSLVIDPGTVEHCFNIGTAFMNAANLAAVGGLVFHNNPANWLGHGFYCLSPCAYFDFYRENGFEFQLFERKITKEGSKIRPRNYKPFLTEIPEKTRMVWNGYARRTKVMPLKFPIQARFTSHHHEEKRV